MNICIIPARGGSTRIPRKNIREFAGIPMLTRAIDTAVRSNLFDRIIVSSDDDEILQIADDNWVTGIRRNPDMSRDEVGTQEVVSHVLEGLDRDEMCFSDVVCCLYPCTPLLLPEDLQRAYERLDIIAHDFLFSVGYPPLQDAGAFYFGYHDSYKSLVPLISPRTGMYLLPPERVCDINTEEDWQRALQLYERMHKK